jgi:hypothetical protein
MATGISYNTRGFQRTELLPVKASGSFKKGQFLIFNSGVDRHAASDANLGATGNTTRIVGMALEDSTRDDGSAKGVVEVMIAEPGTQFLLPLYHATPASAVATPASQLGRSFELRNVGGNYDAIALDATTNTKLKIVGYATEEYPTWPGRITDTAGSVTAGTTQYANAWVEVLGSATCLSGAE